MSSRVNNNFEDDSSDGDRSDDERYANESYFDIESDVDGVPSLDNFVHGDEAIDLSSDEDEELQKQHESSVAAIKSNRGQKYTSQGKSDNTIWWSMPSQTEKERTETMKQTRMQFFVSYK